METPEGRRSFVEKSYSRGNHSQRARSKRSAKNRREERKEFVITLRAKG